MSDNTNYENEQPEDNKLIRKLRDQIDKLTSDVETAGDAAVAKVKRAQQAAGLMPEEFKGLADVFEAEVDGELDAESAAKWLAGRGFTASSDELKSEAAEAAEALERVTNLGTAVVAAGSLTPTDTVTKQLEDLKESGEYKTLPDLTAAIDKILQGQG